MGINIKRLFSRLKYLTDFNFNCRYAQAIRFLKGRPVSAESAYRLLEVGSGDAGIGQFHLGHRNLALDICFGDNHLSGQQKVCASTVDIPFEDSSFDFVVSVDTLEHLPAELRIPAVKEMWRVTKGYLIITLPCSEASAEYESRLFSLFNSRNIPIPGWLTEHRRYGLPSEGEIRKIISGECVGNLVIDTLPSGDIASWYRVNSSICRGKAAYLLTNLLFSINLMFSKRLLNAFPAYRKTFIIVKESF